MGGTCGLLGIGSWLSSTGLSLETWNVGWTLMDRGRRRWTAAGLMTLSMGKGLTIRNRSYIWNAHFRLLDINSTIFILLRLRWSSVFTTSTPALALIMKSSLDSYLYLEPFTFTESLSLGFLQVLWFSYIFPNKNFESIHTCSLVLNSLHNWKTLLWKRVK